MSSDASLGKAIESTVARWCSENGGGFPVGFVIALDFVNENGESLLVIAQADQQATHRSMGLVSYLTAWYADDANAEFMALREMGGE